MFERPQQGEQAVLVHILFASEHRLQNQDEDVSEFAELVASTGVSQAAMVSGKKSAPDPRLFIGTGKAQEIKDLVASQAADVVIFDHALSPSQERNLEAFLQCRVLDRTGLILDIFAQRARSHEGKLQVELAQLQHLSTRLVRGWTHLERQKGGIGMRGPGEKQLETDRRLLAERIKGIRRRLDKVRQQREQGRQLRKKAEIPTISLVGYTNAGKSTLFNALSGAKVYAADQLFATLDPTLRRVELPDNQSVVLADTVGFIRQLPHDLVAAFRATLQETEEADLLLHVIDASDPERNSYIDQVNQVLGEIGAAERPQILVYNKIDLADVPHRCLPAKDGFPPRVWVSAKTGEGLETLLDVIADQFARTTVRGRLLLPMNAGQLRAELFRCGAVLHEEVTSDGLWALDVTLSQRSFGQLSSRFETIDFDGLTSFPTL
ncbi:MAG TPA: GTPase HflX [Gammaproteobacteria bacterium]|nr:GTPase HflX [Gammaproteobacteria bacterium]